MPRASVPTFHFSVFPYLWDSEISYMYLPRAQLDTKKLPNNRATSPASNKFLESNSICCKVVLKCSMPFTHFLVQASMKKEIFNLHNKLLSVWAA